MCILPIRLREYFKQNNNIYITDARNHQVSKFSAEGQFITQWGELGSNPEQFVFPSGIAISIEGESTYVYVVDTANARIQKFTAEEKFVTEWGHGYKPAMNLLNLSIFELPNLIKDGGNSLRELFNQKDERGFIGIAGIAVDTNNHVYHNGEPVQINFPYPLTDEYQYYVAISLPSGDLFTLTNLNVFIPFDVKAIPIWTRSEKVIAQEVNSQILRGEYRLYWVRLPTGVKLKLPPELHSLHEFVFYVEE